MSDLLNAARDQHRRGQLAEAISAYASFLAANPARGDVWHMKAIAEHQLGRIDASWESVSHALESQPEANVELFAGIVLQDRGDVASAERHYARAAELKPGWAPPLANRGQALMDMGRADEALESFRAAADVEPGNARTWNNIGMALMALDRMDEARRAFDHALMVSPTLARAHYNLGRLYNLRGDAKRAMEHAQAAVSAEPGLTDAHLLLGDLHRKRRDEEAMLRSFEDAVRSAPASARARSAYAECLSNIGRTIEAREEYRRVAQADPHDLAAALGANLMLPQVYIDTLAVPRWRAAYEQGLAHLEAAAGGFRFSGVREAMLQARWTNFYLAYQGQNDRELQSRFGDFMHGVLQREAPQLMQPRSRAGNRERIRVGFCSHFFFNCTAGRYFASWVMRLDRGRFDVYVYYTNEWIADDTRAIAATTPHFRHLPGRGSEIVARHILDDDLDVLVYPELGMHGDTFARASLRLAPVQVAGWGHPTTTGLPSIDHFLSSEAMEPADAAEHYRERLALLPGLGTHYAVPSGDASSDRDALGLPEDATLYLVPQSLFKIHPDNDELLAKVLAADPRGRLVMFAAHYDAVNTTFATRFSAVLERHGLSLRDRVVFLPYMTHAEYLGVNRACDVMLDTLHWSGGNTSLDALACGLPVVTLPGRYMRGRQSAGMLRTIGVEEELVVGDADAYVRKAAELGKDADLRQALAERIRAGRPALFERDEPIRALEDFLERAVRDAR